MQHETLIEFVEQNLIPKKRVNPDHIRLDGKHSGGNRTVMGLFSHNGKSWKVHGDSSYEPLFLAYEFIKNKNIDPFVENVTRNGICLVLKQNIQQLKEKPRFKHLYIYVA